LVVFQGFFRVAILFARSAPWIVWMLDGEHTYVEVFVEAVMVEYMIMELEVGISGDEYKIIQSPIIDLHSAY